MHFYIQGSYTPGTLPMKRLAEYLAQLSALYGDTTSIHFQKVVKGSTQIVATVDEPAHSRVRDRVFGLATGGGPADARKAYDSIDAMLREDNAYGKLKAEGIGKVIPFPGRKRPLPPTIGPFKAEGSLEGQVIRIGGRDETMPVMLRDGAVVHSNLNAKPSVAKELAKHFLGAPVRVYGVGTWFRNPTGRWEMQSFTISRFDLLDDISLEEAVKRIRRVPGSIWSDVPDPVALLQKIRSGGQ
jgi:hypothetical protein